MMSMEGFRPHLREVLQRLDAPSLLAEATGVAAYASSSEHRHLPAAEFLPPILALLEFSYSHSPGHPFKSKDPLQVPDTALLMPVLRCLGNLLAVSSPEEVLPYLARDENHLRRLLEAACNHRHGTQKEALWVLSNFSALHTPARSARTLLAAVGGEQVLVKVLREGTFPLRKECLICLRNHCSGDSTEILGMVGSRVGEVSQGILPAIASLARSQDPEAAYQALCVFEAVLRGLPGEGAQMVESVEGIEILEEQQMRGAGQCQELATQLLDSFYGNDYGWKDA